MRYRHKIAAIRRIAAYLMARNVAPVVVLRRLDLPAAMFLADQNWIDRRLSLQLTLEMVDVTGNPLAGVEVGALIEFADFGNWGEGIVKSRTLLDAITYAGKSMTSIETGTRLGLRTVGDKAHLSLEYFGHLGADPRQHMEADLLVLRKMVELAGEPVPMEFHFPHSRRRDLDLEPWFGPGLAFDRDRGAVIFDRDALRLPLLRRPEFPVSIPVVSADITARRVMQALQQVIAFERPTAQGVAALLAINVRMMQRHLSSWGITFEDLLDQYRRHLAAEYMQSGRYSITDIAFRLGYSDSAHFTRAFRRWTGRSPRQAMREYSTPRQGPLTLETA